MKIPILLLLLLFTWIISVHDVGARIAGWMGARWGEGGVMRMRDMQCIVRVRVQMPVWSHLHLRGMVVCMICIWNQCCKCSGWSTVIGGSRDASSRQITRFSGRRHFLPVGTRACSDASISVQLLHLLALVKIIHRDNVYLHPNSVRMSEWLRSET